MKDTQTPNIDIVVLESFINLWLCKTRIEIETLVKDNFTLREDMLRSQLSSPLEAWHNIKKRLEIKVVDVEDCTICGYTWTELKQIIDFAKSKDFDPRKENL